jgi:hypothetical protein
MMRTCSLAETRAMLGVEIVSFCRVRQEGQIVPWQRKTGGRL